LTTGILSGNGTDTGFFSENHTKNSKKAKMTRKKRKKRLQNPNQKKLEK